MGEICLNCGSENIRKEVMFGSSGDGALHAGPKYRTGLVFNLLSKVEPTWCDICLECGEITRLYIKDTDHEWWTRTEVNQNKLF